VSGQVTFTYIVLFKIQIVSKQLYGDNRNILGKKVCCGL